MSFNGTSRIIENLGSNWRNNYLILTLRQIFKNKLAVAATIYLLAFITIIILADVIAPFDPTEMHMEDTLVGPNATYKFGTDDSGRDIFSRVLYGGRISLRVGFISAGIAISLGLPLGLASGFYGGNTQTIILRAVDVMLAFPSLLLALIVVAILGKGVDQVMIAVGIANVPTFVRVVNSSVITMKENEYIMAGRVIGASDFRLVTRHVLPNIVAPVIVMATLYVAGGILSASSLSFLGLGAQPPSPEWGAMISRGRHNLRLSPWMSTFPGLAIASIVISLNVIGDALRDALDPWMRAR